MTDVHADGEVGRLGRDCTAQQVLDRLDADGAVIIEDYVDADVVEQVRADLRPYLDGGPSGRDRFAGYRTRRVGAIMARSPASHALVLDPLLNEACDGLLGPHADSYQLHLTQLVAIGPGEGRQPMHRDRGVWYGKVPRSTETQFSTNWALTDFTIDNGATRVVPGSHRWDDDRRAEPDEVAHAEMSAGSVLVYTGSVLHSGGMNQTDQVREGLLLHFTLDWLRQEENQYLSCPPEIARDLPPELRRLIGYDATFTMGFCSPPGVDDELVSPAALFRAQEPAAGSPG